ncbi:hypothetical protein [Bradyrhizobium erythrophlei]|jgi:hypothetical protein|uniref:Uncharacterized protein n=1 Tax=Bradyrhizobium erythrophlei TaxID=1437360 RepID=A0A1M7U5Z9_9BRAD|nr:hypothetical protein [Bradyrhizobium erythrophlei]SHN78378.1 hypothetical protein SAMN05444170_3660 [Bradyrhizobium erythrophlei]
MTRSLIIVFAILAVIVGGELLSPRPDALEEATAAMPSLEELHSMAGVHQLPLQDIEDQSLMYPTAPNEEARPKP